MTFESGMIAIAVAFVAGLIVGAIWHAFISSASRVRQAERDYDAALKRAVQALSIPKVQIDAQLEHLEAIGITTLKARDKSGGR